MERGILPLIEHEYIWNVTSEVEKLPKRRWGRMPERPGLL
jgi:hypothetical protein